MNELERVYRQSKSKHIRVLSHALRDYHEAEDVFHNAVCRAVKYFPTYNPKLSPINVWFSRIVYNELSRHFRAKKKSLDLTHLISYENFEEVLPELYLEVIKQVEELEGDQHLVVSSYFVKGYGVKEICKATGLSERFIRVCNTLFRMELRDDD